MPRRPTMALNMAPPHLPRRRRPTIRIGHRRPQLEPSIRARATITLLVQRQRIARTTHLRRITRTRHVAAAPLALGRRVGRGDAVVAVALVAVLDAGEAVALAGAEGGAAGDGHVLVRVRGAGEGAAGHGVGGAALVGPALRGHVGVGDGGRDGGDLLLLGREDGSGAGAFGDGVVAGEGFEFAADGFVDHGGDGALVLLVVGEEGAEAAGELVLVVTGVAGLDLLLEIGDVPAVDEVAVETVAGWVTLGEDELAFEVSAWHERAHVIVDFEKDVYKFGRMSRRTLAVVIV